MMDTYEKKYNEALERAKQLAEQGGASRYLVTQIFPELKESEDERIRKALIDGVRQIRCKNGITQEQMIAYLEKQKEQKPSDDDPLNDPLFIDGFDTGREVQKIFDEPAKWSEEDERILKGIIGKIDHDQAYGVSKAEMLSFLKRLRPSWKPSEEQMEALLWCIAHLGGADRRVLAELYEHLKMYCQ